MKQYLFGLALLGLASHAFAQNEADALRYSRLQFGGPSRTLGIGGANVALGGDLGNLVSNPAGLGLLQRSEVSFTPGTSSINSDAQVINPDATAPKVSNSRNNLHVASLALAFADRRPDSDDRRWRGGTLAVGFNRVNDFNAQFRYSHTIADRRSYFQRLREPYVASGRSLNQTYDDIFDQYQQNSYYNYDGLAYGAFLTDFNATGDSLIISRPLQGRTSALQEETVLTTGSQTQFDVAYGGSYLDKLYIGAGLGIVGTRFNSTSTLNEANGENPGGSFGSFELRDVYQTRGSGFNLRLGAIYKPVDFLRVGVSAQTPTWYQLDDNYYTSLTANFRQPITVGGQQYTTRSVSTDNSTYSYRLTTPWRLNGGVAAILGKYGFISVDVERVNYAKARLRNAPDLEFGDDSSFDYENGRVSSLYQPTMNVRVGAEGRLGIFRLRGGYAHYGDPYANSVYDRAQNFITGGAGVRFQSVFVDVAGVYNTSDRLYQPYTLRDDTQPRVAVATNRFTTNVTVGVQF